MKNKSFLKFFFFILPLFFPLCLRAQILDPDSDHSIIAEEIVSYISAYADYRDEKWKNQVRKYFKKHTLVQIEEVLNFLEKRIGREEVLKRLKKSITEISKLRLDTLEGLIKVYEEYLGKEGVNQRLKKSLGGFHSTTPEKLKGVILVLESYLEREELIDRMKADLQGFAMTDAEKLTRITQFLSSHLETQNIREILIHYLREVGSQRGIEALSSIIFTHDKKRNFEIVESKLREIRDYRSGENTEDAVFTERGAIEYLARNGMSLKDILKAAEEKQGKGTEIDMEALERKMEKDRVVGEKDASGKEKRDKDIKRP